MCKYFLPVKYRNRSFLEPSFFVCFCCFVFYTIHRLCGIYLHFNIVLYTFKNLKKSWNKKTFKPHNFLIYISWFSSLGFSSYKILPVLEFPQNTRHKEYAFFLLAQTIIYMYIYVFIYIILSSENRHLNMVHM